MNGEITMHYPMMPYENGAQSQSGNNPMTAIMKDATLGAMVGATAATAIQLKKKEKSSHGENPLGAILKAGIASGLATAAASAVGNTVAPKNSTAATLGAMFVTGTAMMYLLGGNNNKGE
jgi:hypothetical protein